MYRKPIEVLQDAREARKFLRGNAGRLSVLSDPGCCENCMREVRAGNARSCSHCGNDCQ